MICETFAYAGKEVGKLHRSDMQIARKKDIYFAPGVIALITYSYCHLVYKY